MYFIFVKKAKHVSTFDFSTLYTKIYHDTLLGVVSTIIELAFRGGTKVRIWVINNTGNLYYLTSIKQAGKYLLENCFFKVDSHIFRQVIGILMGLDPAPFFINLFLFNCESEWVGKMKNIDHHRARRSGHVYRFTDDLLTIIEILKICNATSSYNGFLSSVYRLISYKKQGIEINNIRKALSNIIFNHTKDF